MIEWIVLGALGMAAAGWGWARRRKRRSTPARSGGSGDGSGPSGLGLGDVLVHRVGDESLWLAGSLEVTGTGHALRLFYAPDEEAGRWLGVLANRTEELAVLTPCDDVPRGRVPDELTLSGRIFRLHRRCAGAGSTKGEQVPEHTPAGSVRYAMLLSADQHVRLILEDGAQRRLVLGGELVPRTLFDFLPGPGGAGQPSP